MKLPTKLPSKLPINKLINKVVIFGVGLIGGSFALALKKQALVKTIIGLDYSSTALQRALELGIVDIAGDEANLAEAIDGADLILIATPVAQTERILSSIYPHLQPQTIVTDVGSTKADVALAARRSLAEKVAQFVPAHPIAGRELHGPDAALADLYQHKKVVITALPENNSNTIDEVARIWECCGAVSHYLTPTTHDEIFAAVSHLPHILAYALVNQISEHSHAELCFQFAASGFQDFTRIAGSSPEMWRDISLANRDALVKEIIQYQAQLQRIAMALQQSDGVQLLATFSQAQAARQCWVESIQANKIKPS